MNYSFTALNFHVSPEKNILIIYTGGTIGMRLDQDGVLAPFEFHQFIEFVPELKRFNYNFSVASFDTLLDSADMGPDHWLSIANIVGEHYEQFDGFVVLQGTDTMAYAAAGVSFLLENLGKPVVFTGAQLPIGAIRNDARKNLLSAIEFASNPEIMEVTIFFDESLLRGNRSRKQQSTHLDAFRSENYPELAHAGVELVVNNELFLPSTKELKVYSNLCKEVVLIKLFPGISNNYLKQVFSDQVIKGVVLETYGAGNASTDEKILGPLRQFISTGGVVLNVSQCDGGSVAQKKYQTGDKLDQIGVISGGDMTSEAALAKLMFVLGNFDRRDAERLLSLSLRGEITL